MLVLDNNVLSDYLEGRDGARDFLRQYERDVWGVPSIVLYEAYMGSLYGYIGGSRTVIQQAITASMEVLDVTEATAEEAAILQEELQMVGVQLDHPDGLIAATAREHDGTFATAEKLFWREEVQEVLDVAEYDPY